MNCEFFFIFVQINSAKEKIQIVSVDIENRLTKK